ncbi:MAG: SPOR domain-containing protein [Sphingomicrobium sp.]
MDRLPWLTDEGEAARGRRSLGLLAWALPLLLLVAAASYWLGANSARWFAGPASPADPQPAAPITLPEPMPAIPDAAAPTIEPVIEPAMPVIADPAPMSPPASARAPAKSVRVAPAKTAPPKPKATIEPKSGIPTPWPVRETDGSAGRLVRVGAFASRAQAKRGWWALMRVNPSLQRLPALVVPSRSARNGKIYYRLQMGTTSQAHSVALCQKLRMIGQSCVVVPIEPAASAA